MKYFEDFERGEHVIVGTHDVTLEEILDFGHAWDPQPLHTDVGAAQASPFGGVIASGAHVVAISVRLLVTCAEKPIAIVAGLGWDHVRFLAPVRPGDQLTLSRRCAEARSSESRRDRGIVRNELVLANQSGAPVLTYEDSLLVLKRPCEKQ